MRKFLASNLMYNASKQERRLTVAVAPDLCAVGLQDPGGASNQKGLPGVQEHLGGL